MKTVIEWVTYNLKRVLGVAIATSVLLNQFINYITELVKAGG